MTRSEEQTREILAQSAANKFPEHLPLLKDLFGLLFRIGLSQEDIASAIQEALASIPSNNDRKKATAAAVNSGNEVAAADALHRWHRDKNFLSRRATPRALSLFGAKASVESMIRIDHPDVDAKGVATELLKARQLKKATRTYLKTV
ncbi:MAG: hypothetical protein QM718_11050 [Steroidobacteraceae bacterium]